ncbi:glycosyltransferase family 2 protein [bacterium]|jgi:hypothetical protein|nr:glycosyltransferase family 2 protein [bacterium]MBT4335217.1 glycosyltransferase family 2 protein [bacterium]MBT4495536.1 glycosyltransferase family 2 protein [bacterium]MBT4764194.1 glycosyltransferase family 2 protein [bacterium]MBT5401566.1 glycosyltransferase family 2 protein [bacterium]
MYKKYKWHKYFWHQAISALSFLIPEGKNILFIGEYNYDFLKNARPKSLDIVNKDIDTFVPDKKYDYIIIFSVLGISENICDVLRNIKSGITSSTRVIIYQHNYLWMPFLKLGSLFRIKNKELNHNWLSVHDTNTYLKSFGYETIRTYKKTLWPTNILFFGNIINLISIIIPLFDIFKINQFIVARLLVKDESEEKSLTICITVRDEKENIEPIVKALPKVCQNQEILFVEGHSTDNTLEEIHRVKDVYSDKNIRVIGQPGIGQGDAIRVGFKDASGDVIILYEGDGTSEPDDIKYFYDAIASGRLEFIEGSRFVYPLSLKSMPLVNKLGNMVFANWFSWFLKSYMTDVLSGIKAISKESYQDIYNNWGSLNLHDPFGDFELLYGAARFNLKLGEIPMKYYPREYGETKTHVFKHGIKLFIFVLKGNFIFRHLKNYNKK